MSRLWWRSRRATCKIVLILFYVLLVVLSARVLTQLNQAHPNYITAKNSTPPSSPKLTAIPSIPESHVHPGISSRAPTLTCEQMITSSLQSEILCLRDNKTAIRTLFKSSKNGTCYTKGTHEVTAKGDCSCATGWHGRYCSIPDIVHLSNYPKNYSVHIRDVPRRIIYGFPFLQEFEMLEARLHELNDLVDIFIIVESNFTSFGESKPKVLLEKLKRGYLKEFQSKIFHVSLDRFPEEAHKNGWIIEDLLRHVIFIQGVSAISNLRKDDVFIVTDCDELPAWESIFFLKYHSGYPEPVGFNLRYTVYGFFWLSKNRNTHVYAACSIGMLEELFGNNPYHLRGAHRYLKADKLCNHTCKPRAWSFGSPSMPSGWHCSWCLRPSAIRTKLLAAQADDGPRWGSFKKKTEIDYIEKLIEDGVWFDESSRHIRVEDRDSRWYAPLYLLNHPEIASHILIKTSKRLQMDMNITGVL